MPIEIRIPVNMVGAAAGKMTVKAVLKGVSSSVFATLRKSRLTLLTPNAVLIKTGHSEQIKITNTEDAIESWMMNSARGIQARGEMGLSNWMKGLNAFIISGDMPITKPDGMATTSASRYPVKTRTRE